MLLCIVYHWRLDTTQDEEQQADISCVTSIIYLWAIIGYLLLTDNLIYEYETHKQKAYSETIFTVKI